MFQAAPIWPDVHILFLELGSVDIWEYIICFVYFLKVIYLVVLGLSCGRWGPLVAARGIQFHDPGLNLGPATGSSES